MLDPKLHVLVSNLSERGRDPVADAAKRGLAIVHNHLKAKAAEQAPVTLKLTSPNKVAVDHKALKKSFANLEMNPGKFVNPTDVV